MKGDDADRRFRASEFGGFEEKFDDGGRVLRVVVIVVAAIYIGRMKICNVCGPLDRRSNALIPSSDQQVPCTCHIDGVRSESRRNSFWRYFECAA